MWVQKDKKDFITFIDPKGLVYVDIDDEKLELASKIKEIEFDLNKKHGKNIILNSFILSITDFRTIRNKNKHIQNQSELEKKHILFLNDKNNKENYLKKMFNFIFSNDFRNKEYELSLDLSSQLLTFAEDKEKYKKNNN